MGQKILKLSTFTPDYWHPGCPVEFIKGAVLQVEGTEKTILQLKFRNNTYNEISDLSFSYVCYNSFGDVLQAGASTDYTMHNISGAPLQFFGDQIPILLSDLNTRSVAITFKKLLYSNGNIQNLDSFIACDVPVQKAMSKEEIKRLDIKWNGNYIHPAKYFALESEFCWCCVCGARNSINQDKCSVCMRSKDQLKYVTEEAFYADQKKENVERLDLTKIVCPECNSQVNFDAPYCPHCGYPFDASTGNQIENYVCTDTFESKPESANDVESETHTSNGEAFVQESVIVEHENEAMATSLEDINKEIASKEENIEPEKEADVKDDLAEEPVKKKKVPAFVVVLLCLGIIGGGAYAAISYLMPWLQYNNAQNLYTEEKYQEAQQAFLDLGGYKNSAEMAVDCRYQWGKQLIEDGQYVEAEEILIALGNYKDSADLIIECQFNQIKTDVENGNYTKALEWLDLHIVTTAKGRLGELQKEMINLRDICYDKIVLGFLKKNNLSIEENNLLQKIDNGSKGVRKNTIAYLQACRLEGKIPDENFEMRVENIDPEIGFLAGADVQKIKSDIDRWNNEIANRKKAYAKYLATYGMDVKFDADYNDVKKDFDFLHIHRVNAKASGDSMVLTVYYNASQDLRVSCFNPPSGNIYLKVKIGQSGDNQLSFSIPMSDFKKINDITMRMWNNEKNRNGTDGRADAIHFWTSSIKQTLL